jgi:hypothetical protein
MMALCGFIKHDLISPRNKGMLSILRIDLSTLSAATTLPPNVNADEVRGMINSLKSVQIIDPLSLFLV